MCFNGKIRKIVPKLFLLPLLIWTSELFAYGCLKNTQAPGEEQTGDPLTPTLCPVALVIAC